MLLALPFRAGGTVAGPIGLLGTTLHEIGHAVVALVTGLHVDGMVVRSNGSGTTYISGHSIGDTAEVAISSAGYVGMLTCAALFLLVGRWPRASRTVFFVAGAVLALSGLLWMDGVFAFCAAAVLGAGCVVVGALVSDRWIGVAATVLGAVLAFSGLSDVAGVERGNVDAEHAAHATGLGLSGVRNLWLLIGFGLVVAAFVVRAVIGRRRRPPAALERADDGTV